MTKAVGVVTDSAANLPADLVATFGITVVPMILKFGERVSLDGVDIDPQEFYRALVEEGVPVSTSAPSIGDFRAAFETALRDAESLVCITVASFVSASFDAATAAAREVDPARITVVDSASASLGEGLPALEAAKLAADGASMQEVAARAADIVSRTQFIATIDTFEFLRRSGRVNAVLAYAGTALNIKPIFAFRGGKIEQLGRVRSRDRAIERLLSELRRAAAEGPLHLGLAHADRAEEAAEVVKTIRREIPFEGDIIVSAFTPLMGAHTGPGVMAVASWR